ncbi:hypothetical protein FPE01S_01_08150 [Flavihumibacter petaseus NBRC 106054]|uniref:VanZ-like domain-containing protein n=2 Tax=Flavihumibacter TaxID=1004301 RepID=A0A0E9MWI2_9BACT|nr:hypothetical protein FPE01S_01_08150 [Flavihumibacter petaseus NBRC 106054]
MHILLLFPHQGMPKEDIRLFPHFDKVVHFGFYFLIVFTWCFYLFVNGEYSPRQKRNWGIFITVLAILDGIAVEFLQRSDFIQRDFDWFDALADGIGAICALVAVLLVSPHLPAQKKPL